MLADLGDRRMNKSLYRLRKTEVVEAGQKCPVTEENVLDTIDPFPLVWFVMLFV